MNIIEEIEKKEQENPEWVENVMTSNRVRVSDIETRTGLNYQAIHQYVSGRKRMTKTMKVILYLYFKHEIKADL